MEIRSAGVCDIDAIMKIYDDARSFMREAGNPDQWKDNYPALSLIQEDIKSGNLYVVREKDEILAVFYYRHGEDITYLKIYEGSWASDCEYGVIHRVAVAKTAHGKGIASFIFDYALERSKSIKIDTHKNNIPMQRALEKKGFKRCGIIYLLSGDERIAYQKCK